MATVEADNQSRQRGKCSKPPTWQVLPGWAGRSTSDFVTFHNKIRVGVFVGHDCLSPQKERGLIQTAEPRDPSDV